MQIKALATDVDGVLTDGGVWWGQDEQEWKRFHFADIMGLSLARKAGLVIALVTGEDSPIVDRLAAKMGISDVYKSCRNKAEALRDIAVRHQLSLEEVCFIGDDVNDLAALALAGISACPADAQPAVREKCRVITTRGGGNGAVREVVDMLLAATMTAAGQRG